MVPGSIFATNERKIKLLVVLYCTLLPFCIADQIVVHAGRVQAASKLVQPLDARIPQQEKVNRVTSCMLIFSAYNYL
jgi:hypothetical protein